jgi:ribonuclease T2
MPSLKALLDDLFRLLPLSHCPAGPDVAIDASCSSPSLSCPSSAPAHPDTCCLNHPSGHFLLTQFWDASPALGSPENWTIHGLWPDYCHGGFDQFCDSDREHSKIDEILSSSGDLLPFMQSHWLSLNGDNNHLWSHEWNKHGTCISTLEPSCYPSSDDGLEAVTSYFIHAANLYSSLNTYATLAAAGIVPSRYQTYGLSDLVDAIAAAHGRDVTFRCRGSELQEIWYHYSVRGPLRHASPFNETLAAQSSTTKMFVPADPDIAKSNCPSSGIRYLPKDHSRPTPPHGTPSHTSTSASHPTGTSTPFSGRGHLIVRPVSSKSKRSDAQQPLHESAATKGCLIKGGLWYASGGCATYLARSDPPHFPHTEQEKDKLFTLSSLYAPCAVIPSAFPAHGGQFMCQNDLGIQTIFEAVNATGGDGGEMREVLAWTGKSKFYADKVPGRFEKVELFIDNKNGERGVKVEIEWQGI